MSTDSSSFTTPCTFDEPVLLADLILTVARLYPDRRIGDVLDEPSADSEVTLIPVTWRQLLADVRVVADHLVANAGHGPRKAGDPRYVVALLAKSAYHYFVTMLAGMLLRWTVRSS